MLKVSIVLESSKCRLFFLHTVKPVLRGVLFGQRQVAL